MFRIGLENGAEGRSCAWALGHPGCFAYGLDGPAALAVVPQAIQDYRQWIAAHASSGWLEEPEYASSDYRLEETWECYTIDSDYELAQEGYEVNAWFRHDWKPLSAEDIRRGLLLLEWGRSDLMQVVQGLSQEILERTYPGERWNISGILRHIGGAEWWYLHRLGLAFERERVPEEPFSRLEMVRTHLIKMLPDLAGSTQVVGIDGEIWSPRKLLRRAVWHERDHIDHIRKLV